jgi:ribonuclease HI
VSYPNDCRAYCDGGILGRNPSKEGGTWALFLISKDDQTVLCKASGIVRPAELEMVDIENNVTELIAAVEALERLPDGWRGVLFSDSQNTIRRLTGRNPSFGGVPAGLYIRASVQRKRFPNLRAVLLDGHPNADQLIAGIGKRGYPVSRWNYLCDQECQILAGKTPKPPPRPRKKKEPLA